MTKLIDLPDDLAGEAARAAKAVGESLDAFVARAVAAEIERERTDKAFAERRARANTAEALRVLDRVGGQSPQPGDKLPRGYKRT